MHSTSKQQILKEFGITSKVVEVQPKDHSPTKGHSSKTMVIIVMCNMHQIDTGRGKNHTLSKTKQSHSKPVTTAENQVTLLENVDKRPLTTMMNLIEQLVWSAKV